MINLKKYLNTDGDYVWAKRLIQCVVVLTQMVGV